MALTCLSKAATIGLKHERKYAIFAAVNSWLKTFAWDFQQLFLFSLRVIRGMVSRKFYISETLEQMYLIGVGSLYLVLLAGAFAGQGFAIAFSNELADFGAKNYLGRIMSIAVVRELGPTLTGLMVAARVSSGITAEIGAMKSSNQLDAMVSFGIDPIQKLAVPRLIALVLMVPALTIACDAIAITGGWIVATLIANMSTAIYWSSMKERLIFGNLFIGLLKPFVFSFFIAFIACYKGFSARGGTKGVGKATTESVVISSITILIVNFFITKLVHSAIRGYL
ncbi:MlaE family lipid ABC transporter permease subunit [candidate division GN15 bacterium]|nr:MlaE family lipid ABC transporter permease subunit [candidate division GN15 bacterium]